MLNGAVYKVARGIVHDLDVRISFVDPSQFTKS
jgi:hypothetical protein